MLVLLCALAACNHSPLKVKDVKDASIATDTKTQTASTTPASIDTAPETQTATTSVQTASGTVSTTASTTSTVTAPPTATVTSTATATQTATAPDCNVMIDFTTALHSKGLFNVKPGDKGVILGTFMLTNTCGKNVEVRDTQIGFIDSSDPRSGNERADSPAAGHAHLVSDHITNCVLRGWPETQVYAGPVSPNNTTRADMIDQYEVPAFNGTNALALDVVCDFTDLIVGSEIGFGVEIMDYEDIQAYDTDGNRIRAIRRTVNGSPPATGVILTVTNGCKVGTTVDIGNGIDPSITGSNSGFGIVWKDNTFMPKEMNKIMFGPVDASGKQTKVDWNVTAADVSDLAIGISATPNGYVAQFDTNLYSNFSFADFDGTQKGVLFNQSIMKMIAGADNETFAFLNDDKSPVLHKGHIAESGFVDEKTYQWGTNATYMVTAGAQTNGTWAFGMWDNGRLLLIVADNGGVYPTVVKEAPPVSEYAFPGDLIATDDGYVMSWSYWDGQSHHNYLSFVPWNGTADGIAKGTVETTAFFVSEYRIDHLAWNGKYVGLLTTNLGTGKTDLFVLDKAGKQIGDAVNMFPEGSGQWFEARGGFAASGSTFGVVMSSIATNKVQFTPVTCN